jgi:predicted AAA+ superfamily ATPase
VGKTTLQRQIIEHLIAEEGIHPRRILRIQFDETPALSELRDPILAVARWYEDRILSQSLNESARRGEPAYFLFDEVQNLPDWGPQVKSLVDHNTVRVMITGSSALRIKTGHDSLAGRVSTIELGPLLLREISGIRFQEEIPGMLQTNGVSDLLRPEFWEEMKDLGRKHQAARDRAFASFSEMGAYPVAQKPEASSWEKVEQYLMEAIIQRALVHDLRTSERGRKRDPQLLEEVFRLSCRYAGQAPGQAIMVQQVHHVLQADISWQRVLHYLRFLNDALLIRLVAPLEIALKKKKGYDKICLCDHALRAAWLKESVPLVPEQLKDKPHFATLAGHLAESIVGYFLGSLPGMGLHHFPERGTEPEVDFVLTIGETRIPMEIKYQDQVTERDAFGLRAFIEKTAYNATFGILITRNDNEKIRDPRIVSLPLSTLLLMR